MALRSHPQNVDSSSDGGMVSNMDNSMWNKTPLKQPTPALSGESRYLSQLYVFGKEELPEEISLSGLPQSIITYGFDLKADNLNPHNPKIQNKIIDTLKRLTFRDRHALVQFWLPNTVGNHQVLTTIDQPFGVGIVDEGLNSYRRDSERNLYVLDKDHEEDLSPPARVFRQRLPEWTYDITNYLPKHFPQQECAIHCNLRGYLALPVFDLTTRLCVGVLELLTTSKYTSFAYEVQQFNNALKTTNLSMQVLECPTSHVPNENRHVELEKIFNILKDVCSIHRLPLAQTWAASPLYSVASHEQILKASCSSFDTRCLGKVCMSTASLPFYVQELRLWPFRKACRERHLAKSHGLVGKAYVSRGSCFCEDLTKLSEDEYPLVHHAHMSELTSCFAIFIHSAKSNDDYVLEFLLPLHREDGRYVQNLVQTLKHNIETVAGFELGDKSPILVVGPRTEASSQYLDIDPHNSTMISSITTATTKTQIQTVSSDPESFKTDADLINSTHVVNQLSPQQDILNNQEGTITSTQNLVPDVIVKDNINVAGARDNENAISGHDMSMLITNDTNTDVGEKNNRSKRGRKRKLESLTMEAVEKHLGKPIDDAAKSLRVSRSTLKRFCRDHNMPSWPLPKHNKKTALVTDSKLSKKTPLKRNLQQSSNTHFGFFSVAILLVRVKRWSCSSKNHGFSGKWWSCGKHSYRPFKLDSMYKVARFMLILKRWRNKKSTTQAIQNRDLPKNKINIINPVSTPVYVSRKQFVTSGVSDIRKVTVKATFKDDMIKFQFPTWSGLSELEKEVAHRIKLQSKKLRLKYKDEDDDLILLACDADLNNLLGLSTSNNSIIKLIIMVD